MDPVEQLALVARAKREVLLRVYGHRLRGQDLEDCYSQATLELLSAMQAGRRFEGRAHLANALELRFVSRVRDRRRALSGRSPLCTALEQALPLGVGVEHEVEVEDPRAEIHPQVVRRLELGLIIKLAAGLTPDQRLALAGELSECERAELCRRLGWSAEKYRKVAQRGRRRLRALLEALEDERHAPVPPKSGSDGVDNGVPIGRSGRNRG
ncbi:MAG TPA: hypothetical protein VGL57_09170 [Solirubrobacteraceae bacterium]